MIASCLPLLGGVALSPARATGPTGADAVAACTALLASDPIAAVGTKVCRTAEQFVWGTAATCRRLLALSPDRAATERCTPIDGRSVSQAGVDAYQHSAVHRALELQHAISAGAPLWEEQILHTHNSFNAATYLPTLTNQDPNQVMSLPQQLSSDIRFLELDLHWVPSPFGTVATGGKWVTLCHGDSGIVPGVHVGCTWDRPLQDGLAEIRQWMTAHPDAFVYLYLENQMGGDPQAHAIAARLLRDAFGSWIAPTAPDGGACAPMPLDASEHTLQAAGSRVLIVGNCGTGNGLGTGWGSVVHERGPKWDESGDPTLYVSHHLCGADEAARVNHTSFRRWYGDSTWLTGVTSHNTDIDAATAHAMTLCGANIVGLDQLVPNDTRLAAQVWSWSLAEAVHPSGDCATQEGSGGADPGRIAGDACTTAHAFACTDATTSTWRITAATGPWSNGAGACPAEFPGSHFAMPVNGLRNALLSVAHTGAAPVWVDDVRVAGVWHANGV